MSQTGAFRLVFLGECMVELKETGGSMARQSFAGDSLNSAVYARRLLPRESFEVQYLSALGIDRFSEAMCAMWEAEGIATTLVRRIADKQPGLYYIHVDAKGERSFSYWRNDAAARFVLSGEEGDALLTQLQDYDCIYLSGISLAILPKIDLRKLLKALSDFKGKVVFDNNFRPALWASPSEAREAYLALLSCCDLALLTWEDEQALFGFTQEEQSAQQCAELGVKEIVIKRGEEPCLIYFDNDCLGVPAEKVTQVIDTTAAGDSFSAAYLCARLQELPPQEAARWGHQLAATVIQHEGGIIGKASMPLIRKS